MKASDQPQDNHQPTTRPQSNRLRDRPLQESDSAIPLNKSVGKKRYLCVWFPNWPVQRLVVDRPELRQQAVVLFYRDSRRGQLVGACSPRAAQAGIQCQMPLAEAKSLAARSLSRQTQAMQREAFSGW